MQERDGSKTVYILLPYFKRGNLQDIINANIVNQSQLPERDILRLFRGVCIGLQQLHHGRTINTTNRYLHNDAHEPLLEDTQETSTTTQSYAHRDIKPSNIMIDEDGMTPILMDFGSLAPSPTPIHNRTEALQVAEQAAQHSTLPYRAPELFNPESGTIDTKVDVWSIGCSIYACLLLHTPFETESVGGSIALAAANGAWKFDDKRVLSDGTQHVIRQCLITDHALRPDIDQVVELIDAALE